MEKVTISKETLQKLLDNFPSFFNKLTKSPFSDKKPYPGWMASDPVFLAISIMF